MQNNVIFNSYLLIRLCGTELTKVFSLGGFPYNLEHFMILIYLNKNIKMNQKDITKGALKGKVAVSRAIDEMVKRGVLRKDVDHTDRRNNLISITEKGKSEYKALVKLFSQIKEKVLKEISKEEMKSYRDITEKMIKNFSS